MGNSGELRKGLAPCRFRARPGLSRGGPSPGELYPLRTRWDLRADPSALSGRALDPKRPAQACDALVHRLQAEVSRERAFRIEAPTIVANFQDGLTCVLLQPQLYTISLGVLDRVVQSLLGYAIDRLFYLQRRVGFVVAE